MVMVAKALIGLIPLIALSSGDAAQCDCMWHLEWTAPTSTEGGAPIEGTITYNVYRNGKLLIPDVQPIPPNDWTPWAWPVVYGTGDCWTVRAVTHLPMDTAVPPYTDQQLESKDSNRVCKNNEEVVPPPSS